MPTRQHVLLGVGHGLVALLVEVEAVLVGTRLVAEVAAAVLCGAERRAHDAIFKGAVVNRPHTGQRRLLVDKGDVRAIARIMRIAVWRPVDDNFHHFAKLGHVLGPSQHSLDGGRGWDSELEREARKWA